MYDLLVATFLLFLFGSAFLIVWVAWQGSPAPQPPRNGEAFMRLQTRVDWEQTLAEELASHPSVTSLYATGDGSPSEEPHHGVS